MELVKSVEEIRKNIQTLNEYLDKKCDPEYTFAIKLIQRGKCFIPVKAKDGYQFYPSKFIGYVENTMNNYQNNKNGDGRHTNKVLYKILNEEPSKSEKVEEEYIKYCKKLGCTKIHSNSRRYWSIL